MSTDDPADEAPERRGNGQPRSAIPTLSDIKKLIDKLRQTIEDLETDGADASRDKIALALCHFLVYENSGDPVSLDVALRHCLNVTDSAKQPVGSHLALLSGISLRRYDLSRNLVDLDRAIRSGYASIGTAVNHDGDPAARVNLGAALLTKFRVCPADAAILEEAIRILRAVLESTPVHERDGALTNLANALVLRAEYFSGAADLDEAIELLRQALRCRSGEDDHRAATHSNLSGNLLRRFFRTHDPRDRAEAVVHSRAAIALTESGRPHSAHRFSIHALALATEGHHTGSSELLGQGFEVLDHALQIEVGVRTDRQSIAKAAARVLRIKFDTTGEVADLTRLIKYLRTSVRLIPLGQADHCVYSDMLAWALLDRYEHTGSVLDLDDARLIAQASLSHSLEGSPEHINFLVTASTVGAREFERTHDQETITAAIDQIREAVQRSEGRPQQGSYLSVMCHLLRMRAEATRSHSDIDAAVECGRQAVGPDEASASVAAIGNLSHALRARFDMTQNRADIAEAVALARLNVPRETTASDRAHSLQSLGTALISSFSTTDELQMLDEAIDTLTEALDLCPPDHPDRCSLRYNLGLALRKRHRGHGDHHLIRQALDSFRMAADVATAPSWNRCYAAREWARTAAWAGYRGESVRGYELAIELLPLAAAVSLPPASREHHLRAFRHLAAEAAVAAVEFGRPQLAALLLDQGRGVILTQAIEAKTDLLRLKRAHPKIHARWTQVHAILDIGGEPMSPLRDDHPRRRNAAQQLHSTLSRRIRKLPGFERFLLPLTSESITSLAADHPLCLPFSDRTRCYALVIANNDVDVLRLETSPDELRAQYESLRTATSNLPMTGRNNRMWKILEWTWATTVEPVLRSLGVTDPPHSGRQWPRLTWVPSGHYCAFPLHAAGTRTALAEANGDSALDRVLSSYAPTLRVLHETRNDPYPASSGAPLLVGVSTLPADSADAGLGTIGRAVAEAEWIANRFFPGYRPWLGDAATVENVLAELPRTGWCHFACHSVFDEANPSNSYLALYDGRLTVAEIMRRARAEAGFAYLSACGTAHAHEGLLEESLHMASAFQVAGFRAVVGTLWRVHDESAERFARGVYDRLQEAGIDIAHAVHLAARAERSIRPGSPFDWAAHAYFGPMTATRPWSATSTPRSEDLRSQLSQPTIDQCLPG
jgi:tetratricopeptide (TPR) repeat protein